jgi:hypothetical protein
MNDRVLLKSRLLATAIHTIGIVVPSITIVLVQAFTMGFDFISTSHISLRSLFLTPLYVTFMIASCLLWILTQRIDYFVDCARIDVINTLINSFLSISVLIGLMVSICSIAGVMEGDEIGPAITLLFTFMTASWYLLHSIASSIFALSGNQGKRISESIVGYRFPRRKIGENI